MTERVIARRYARALFEVTVRDKNEEPSTAEHDLEEFVTLLEAVSYTHLRAHET